MLLSDPGNNLDRHKKTQYKTTPERNRREFPAKIPGIGRKLRFRKQRRNVDQIRLHYSFNRTRKTKRAFRTISRAEESDRTSNKYGTWDAKSA